jgi:hypothetical protein
MVLATMTGGATVGADVREAKPRSDGFRHVDTPALIARLRAIHANTYVYEIWDTPTDWQDLVTEFAPAATRAHIAVLVYVVPPSECTAPTDPVRYRRGACSEPFQTDYVAWARAVATLSRQQPAVIGWAIDDFLNSPNPRTFTPGYLARITAAAAAINPTLEFWTTVYYSQAVDDRQIAAVAPYLTGLMYAYRDPGANTQDSALVTSHLSDVLDHAGRHRLKVMLMVYAGRLSSAMTSPTAAYVGAVLAAARPFLLSGRISGVVSYGTPLTPTTAINAEDRALSGRSWLSLSMTASAKIPAGTCAQASQTMTATAGTSGTLTFSAAPTWRGIPTAAGALVLQVRVNGTTVWQGDPGAGILYTYARHTVRLTDAVGSDPSVGVDFRLCTTETTVLPGVDVAIDGVSSTGLEVRDGGFETGGGWSLSPAGGPAQAVIQRWTADEPSRVADVVAAAFASAAGSPAPATAAGSPAPATAAGSTQDPPSRWTMNGPRALRFSVPPQTPVSAGQCARASQRVAVATRFHHATISTYSINQGSRNGVGVYAKRILIDGVPIMDVDPTVGSQGIWIRGEVLRPRIDLTDLVTGHQSVTLTFELCATRTAADAPIVVGFDDIDAVGLTVDAPTFDAPGAWTLRDDHGLGTGLEG